MRMQYKSLLLEHHKGVPILYGDIKIAEREIMDYEESRNAELWRENSWCECLLLMPANPIKMYKSQHPMEELPMVARDDGYSLEDDPFYTSYGTFEKECLNDTDSIEEMQRDIARGRMIVKNNIFVDDTISRIASINRIEMNWADGFVQNSIISGKVSDKKPEEYSSWFTPDRCAEIGNPILVMPQMIANKAYNVSFSRNKVGNSEFFFEDRNDFTQAYMDNPIGQADSMMVNDAMNPEFISFKTNLTNVQAFDNVYAYSQATGRPTFAELCCILIQINYFVHEVINVLLPKQIVLIMDTYRGIIDIPRKDYVPTIADPVINIPDYNNKILHIIEMMKTIAQKGLFHPYVGNCYLKLSITPALMVISFISEYAPQLRLILALPTIDNQILYDAEVKNGISTSTYTYGAPFQSRRYHDSHRDVVYSIGEEYHDRLMGIPNQELKEYINPYVTHGKSIQPTIYQENKSMFGWRG